MRDYPKPATLAPDSVLPSRTKSSSRATCRTSARGSDISRTALAQQRLLRRP
ncbi:hypothetical protein DBL07_07255 [Achromobacter mucicolens]|nr:hypothetical protein DBL07_07255 [Achromobacter mucicolens]